MPHALAPLPALQALAPQTPKTPPPASAHAARPDACPQPDAEHAAGRPFAQALLEAGGDMPDDAAATDAPETDGTQKDSAQKDGVKNAADALPPAALPEAPPPQPALDALEHTTPAADAPGGARATPPQDAAQQDGTPSAPAAQSQPPARMPLVLDGAPPGEQQALAAPPVVPGPATAIAPAAMPAPRSGPAARPPGADGAGDSACFPVPARAAAFGPGALVTSPQTQPDPATPDGGLPGADMARSALDANGGLEADPGALPPAAPQPAAPLQAPGAHPAHTAQPARTTAHEAAPAAAHGSPTLWLHGKTAASLALEHEGQPLHVQVSVQGQAAHVHFSSDAAHTRQWLDASSEQLRELLQGQGLQLGAVSVDARGPGQQQHPARAAAPQPPSALSAARGSPPAGPPAPATAPALRPSGIDCFV